MMGRQEAGQAPLFYAFNLEEHVPANHLLRGIDQFLDLSELHRHLAPHYSHTGRPSVDPALLIRMLIVGYCFGIRSERRLCEEVHLNLAYRWFCRLGLEDAVPDHSTFSKNRHGRFRDNDTLRFVFEKVLERCLAEGLVGGEGFAIDASVIKADANRRRMYRSTGKATADDTLIYRSSVYDCADCELKSRCCPNTTHRKIARQVHESDTRRGSPTGDDTSIRAIAPTSKEGRDAVRSPQTHPAAGSLAAPRPERCAR